MIKLSQFVQQFHVARIFLEQSSQLDRRHRLQPKTALRLVQLFFGFNGHRAIYFITTDQAAVFPLSILLPVRLGLFSGASLAAQSRRSDFPGAPEFLWPDPKSPLANRPAARPGSRSFCPRRPARSCAER